MIVLIQIFKLNLVHLFTNEKNQIVMLVDILHHQLIQLLECLVRRVKVSQKYLNRVVVENHRHFQIRWIHESQLGLCVFEKAYVFLSLFQVKHQQLIVIQLCMSNNLSVFQNTFSNQGFLQTPIFFYVVRSDDYFFVLIFDQRQKHVIFLCFINNILQPFSR